MVTPNADTLPHLFVRWPHLVAVYRSGLNVPNRSNKLDLFQKSPPCYNTRSGFPRGLPRGSVKEGLETFGFQNLNLMRSILKYLADTQRSGVGEQLAAGYFINITKIKTQIYT